MAQLSKAADVKEELGTSPAVDVKQKARPAMHDEPIVPKTPARGSENRMPIANGSGEVGNEPALSAQASE